MAWVHERPRKTVDDYLALGEDVLAELIDGEIYVTPAPGFEHQDVVGALYVHLRSFVEAHELGRTLLAPTDVYLPSGDIVQPDLGFVRMERLDIIDRVVRGAPDLVIEVVSPARSERDRIVKKALFAGNGIGEFWIVDPLARSIEIFLHADGSYAPAGWFTGNATAVSPTLPGLEIPLASIFRPDPSPPLDSRRGSST